MISAGTSRNFGYFTRSWRTCFPQFALEIHLWRLRARLCDFQIEVDVPRTSPGVPLFQEPQIQEVHGVIAGVLIHVAFVFIGTHSLIVLGACHAAQRY